MASKKISEVVRELREAQGLTQRQLAERAQVSVSFITILESGRLSNLPSPLIVERLAQALSATPARLTGERA